MRLDKFICRSTELSRNEARQFIHSGAITVNAEVVLAEAFQVHENNDVMLDGQQLSARDSRYLMLHKPAGTVCSNIDEAYPSVFNLVDIGYVDSLHVVGRLDANTSGLVLMTDDGRWSFEIIRPDRKCEKVYRVGLRDPVSNDAAMKFSMGIQLQGEDQLTLPAKLEILSQREVLLTITEGKYHQVKRMFAAIGNRVLSLHREKIGDVYLDLELSQWRYLTVDEVGSFKN
jgi:16S rRNA pseudouridine516 synthase